MYAAPRPGRPRRESLRCGATPAQLRESALHGAPLVGLPRALAPLTGQAGRVHTRDTRM